MLKKCGGCNGKGLVKELTGITKCPICNGIGQVYVRKDAPQCGRCSGTGLIKLGNLSIDWCEGRGGTG